MTAIGGKSRKATAPTQPQYVIKVAQGINEFAHISADDKGHTIIAWIGDPNAATKFNSKYEAKYRTRDMADIPETRIFQIIEKKS